MISFSTQSDVTIVVNNLALSEYNKYIPDKGGNDSVLLCSDV